MMHLPVLLSCLITQNVFELFAETKHGVKTKTIAMDFTRGLSAYGPIKEGLAGLDIAVLINNVGMNYDHPEFFTEIPR